MGGGSFDQLKGLFFQRPGGGEIPEPIIAEDERVQGHLEGDMCVPQLHWTARSQDPRTSDIDVQPGRLQGGEGG